MTTAICPGSFDPPTNGHVDVVERAAHLFDRVVVAVLRNRAKQPLFDIEERVVLLKEALAHIATVDVVRHEGLLVDLATECGAEAIVKGLRSTSDLSHELQMAGINAALAPATDTVFIAAAPEWSFVSSSMVKEVARYGGDIRGFVPPCVAEALGRHFATGTV